MSGIILWCYTIRKNRWRLRGGQRRDESDTVQVILQIKIGMQEVKRNAEKYLIQMRLIRRLQRVGGPDVYISNNICKSLKKGEGDGFAL